MAQHLLQGQEGRVDGAVPQGYGLQGLPLLIQLDAGGGADVVAAVGHIADQLIGGGHMPGELRHQGVQIPVIHLLFGGQPQHPLINPLQVLLLQVIAHALHLAPQGEDIGLWGDGLLIPLTFWFRRADDPAEGGTAGAVHAQKGFHLLAGTLQLGVVHLAFHLQGVAPLGDGVEQLAHGQAGAHAVEGGL